MCWVRLCDRLRPLCNYAKASTSTSIHRSSCCALFLACVTFLVGCKMLAYYQCHRFSRNCTELPSKLKMWRGQPPVLCLQPMCPLKKKRRLPDTCDSVSKMQCVICEQHLFYLFVYYKNNGHMFWSYFMRKETPLPRLLKILSHLFATVAFFVMIQCNKLVHQCVNFLVYGGYLANAKISSHMSKRSLNVTLSSFVATFSQWILNGWILHRHFRAASMLNSAQKQIGEWTYSNNNWRSTTKLSWSLAGSTEG